jgi:putative membrane protein
MKIESTVREAKFKASVCAYWVLTGSVTLAVTVVGLPLLPIWIFVGPVFTAKYLASMECVLTSKALKIKKGVFVRVEKTIPLEKITDMGMIQGPIMRRFNLHTLTVETAGQSGPGALVSLTGIVDAKDFRQAVLDQRDETSSVTRGESAKHSTEDSIADSSVLTEIRDTLLRIEGELKKS